MGGTVGVGGGGGDGGYKVIIMPLRGPNWLSQVWHWPGQLGWGQSVAKLKSIIFSFGTDLY